MCIPSTEGKVDPTNKCKISVNYHQFFMMAPSANFSWMANHLQILLKCNINIHAHIIGEIIFLMLLSSQCLTMTQVQVEGFLTQRYSRFDRYM